MGDKACHASYSATAEHTSFGLPRALPGRVIPATAQANRARLAGGRVYNVHLKHSHIAPGEQMRGPHSTDRRRQQSEPQISC